MKIHINICWLLLFVICNVQCQKNKGILRDILATKLSLLTGKKDGEPLEQPISDNGTNIYEEVKNSTVKHQSTQNKSEHGKWDIPFLRDILGFAEKVFQMLIKPVILSFKGTETVIEKTGLVPECKGLDTNQTFFSGVLEDFKAKVHGVFPGTKWCGAGSIANNENDLGVYSDTDSCCRHHDSCPENIAAGKTKYALKNSGLFTRSLCDCDENFYNCLKQVNSAISDELGITYFNILGPQCFISVNCSDPKVTCRNGAKEGVQFQWSDNPKF